MIERTKGLSPALCLSRNPLSLFLVKLASPDGSILDGHIAQSLNTSLFTKAQLTSRAFVFERRAHFCINACSRCLPKVKANNRLTQNRTYLFSFSS